MARPRNITPSTELRLTLPEDWRSKLDSQLYSEVEGRVPHAAYKTFFVARIREFLTWRGLDLAPFTGAQAGSLIVRGEPEAIRTLEDLLRDALRLKMIVQKLEADETAAS